MEEKGKNGESMNTGKTRWRGKERSKEKGRRKHDTKKVINKNKNREWKKQNTR